MCKHLTLIILLAVIFYSDASGQGRTSSDPILHRISFTKSSIDHDPLLRSLVDERQNIISFYKKDSLQKLVLFNNVVNGTERVTCYFTDRPIFISVERNNFPYYRHPDIREAIASFSDIDTLNGIPLFPRQVSAHYYFHKGNVRFAAVVIYSGKEVVVKVRHDEKGDIAEGMKWLKFAKEIPLISK